MKCELLPNNDKNNIIKSVLLNRGIDNYEQYLCLTNDCVQDYNDLDNIQNAVECFVEHYEKNNTISILVDSDSDGFCSASMMYLYIKKLNQDYPVHMVMHKKNKAHGLDSYDYDLPKDTKLFIIPDAGSNDVIQHRELYEKGVQVICLDHHNIDATDVTPAIIVNNQASERYKNKDLCGAGITYRFLQALDDALWEEYSDDFLDLVAVANIADVMDLRSFETRYLVDSGLANGFKNKFLQELFGAQNFSTKGILNIHNVAWYISPVINALIRIGSLEERVLVMKAFTEQYDEFPYKKRDGDVVTENIYQHVVRLAKNAKTRQDNKKKKIIESLTIQIDDRNKINMLFAESDNEGLSGLVAMSLADKCKKPTIVLTYRMYDDKRVWAGSIRNFNNSPIRDFRQWLLDTGTANFVRGHDNAAGIEFDTYKLADAITKINDKAQAIDMSPVFYVDFIIEADELNSTFIYDVTSYKDVWCTGVGEPYIVVKNASIRIGDIEIIGKSQNTFKFFVGDVEFIQFNLSNGDCLYDIVNEWGVDDNDIVTLDIVGKCEINNYNNMTKPQFVISDCNISVND